MGKTRTPVQDVSTQPPVQDAGANGLNLGGLPQLAGTLGNAAMLGLMGGGLGAGPALAAGLGAVMGAVAPTKEYVDMSSGEKTGALVGVMNNARGVLDANDVSANMEGKLAGIMINEGSRNLRRKNVGDAMTTQARGLQGKLKGVDMAALQADPKKMAAFTKGMNEEQRYLFQQVQSGALDLSALDSKDAATKKAASEQLTQAGIDLRVNQYTEMSDLMAKQAGGTKLSKEESARLTALKGLSGKSKIGMAGNMGDLAGMSPERFREIYDEGQQRFEPAQYKALKASYEANLKKQKKPGDPVTMRSGIGSFSMDAAAQTQLGQSSDLIADMATSYGTAQIMGAYAQQGLLTAKGADKTDHTFSLAELKDSANRLTPNSTDIQMQLAFMNMKNIDMTSASMSTSTLTQLYNGSAPGTAKNTEYSNDLDTRSAAYLAAKKKASAPKT